MPLASTLVLLALADCDDITAAPPGDLFLACHSPSDKFTVSVVGQKRNNDEMDCYVIRLKKTTHEILYVTRLGGSAYDSASRVAIDASGNVWISGMTYSTDLPAEGAYGGGDGDGFVAKFTPSLNSVLFASYSGSPSRELGEGIAVIPGGAAMTMVHFGNKEGIPVGPFLAQPEIMIWRQ